MNKETLAEVIALLNTANYDTESLKHKRDEVVNTLKEQLQLPFVTCSSREDLEHLIAWNLSKNHTERYGVIKGKYSRTYSFMHEDKNKVLDWLIENYR